jgi:DNA-directed RNA polymerase specialized sigma24 family protein
VNTPRQDELPDLTDADVLRLAQQGDTVAFERIYRLHSRKVHKLPLRRMGAPTAAEDLTQICQKSYEVPDLQFEGSRSGLASWAWVR